MSAADSTDVEDSWKVTPRPIIRQGCAARAVRREGRLLLHADVRPGGVGEPLALPDPAKRCYYVFHDPNQNLFVDNPSLPDELGPPYLLPANCRNTVRISAHCASLVGRENQSREGAPEGKDPEFVPVGTVREAVRAAGRQIGKLCLSNLCGLKPSQVAVLAPASAEKFWPNRIATIPLTRDFEEWREGKGLEADAVVIVETPMRNRTRESVSRYVARSRAKHMLTVIEVAAA